MKRILLMLLMFISLQSFGQQIQQLSDRTVKDETGKILTQAAWVQLLNSGQYRLNSKGEKDANGQLIFIAEKLTEEQKGFMLQQMPKPRTSDAFVEGELFRGDQIRTMDGLKFDFRKNTNQIYVINFWFINCPPCKQEIPDLNALVAQYKSNSEVVFIAIALDERNELKNFLKTTGFDYHMVPDGRYYSEKYGVKSYPTHVIVGKDNKIKFSTVGLAPNTVNWIQKTIDAQLQLK